MEEDEAQREEEKEKQIISCRLSHFWGGKKKQWLIWQNVSENTNHHLLHLICCAHMVHTEYYTNWKLFKREEYLLLCL